MKILHHESVKCWCIHGSEWKDFEGVLSIIRSEEIKFLLVEDVDSYLMVTFLGVHGNNIYCVGSYSNKGNSVVITKNGVLERFGNFVQSTVGDTHPPD